MPKRKKYPKLPNGYGSIRYLGKGRRNPYAVHPPTEDFTVNGSPLRPAALCYVNTWIKGFTVLTAYKAGNYYPGYENTLTELDADADDGAKIEALAEKILADYNQFKGVPVEGPGKTFEKVYQEYYTWKYETDKSKTYSKSTMDSTRAAFKNCKILHDKTFAELRHDDMQAVLDNCPLKHASLELILSLFHQMYAYADIYELTDKDYSAHLKINIPEDDEGGIPFSEDDLKALWKNKDNDIAAFLLVMCYSGYRISAYKTLEVNLEDKYFRGGVKTAAGKNRIVPIHSAILPLVKRLLEKNEELFPIKIHIFRRNMRTIMNELKLDDHTPHDCRHTFSTLCEKYGVNENDRKRMLGHSFGNDITNAKYGHRSLDDLRREIEKIKIPDMKDCD